MHYRAIEPGTPGTSQPKGEIFFRCGKCDALIPTADASGTGCTCAPETGPESGITLERITAPEQLLKVKKPCRLSAGPPR